MVPAGPLRLSSTLQLLLATDFYTHTQKENKLRKKDNQESTNCGVNASFQSKTPSFIFQKKARIRIKNATNVLIYSPRRCLAGWAGGGAGGIPFLL